MIIEVKSIKLAHMLEEILKCTDERHIIHKDVYQALSHHEAQEALDYKIENEDLFITEEQYDSCLKATYDKVYNSDENVMQDYTDLAKDLAVETLKEHKILVD